MTDAKVSNACDHCTIVTFPEHVLAAIIVLIVALVICFFLLLVISSTDRSRS